MLASCSVWSGCALYLKAHGENAHEDRGNEHVFTGVHGDGGSVHGRTRGQSPCAVSGCNAERANGSLGYSRPVGFRRTLGRVA